MKAFNYPDKEAYMLGSQLKRFLAKTETTAYSEINPHADRDRIEVVRQINWAAFNEIIEQLQFTYKMRKQYGRS